MIRPAAAAMPAPAPRDWIALAEDAGARSPPFWRMPWRPCARACCRTAGSRRPSSSASSTPATASPGSRPTRRRCASSPPMAAGSPRRASRRNRGVADRHRRGRVLRAGHRRNPDEPGRDRALAGARPRARRHRRRMVPAVDVLAAEGNTPANRARLVALDARGAGAATAGGRWPRRDAGGDPRRDAQVLRDGGAAARPPVAPLERLHPPRRGRQAGRARRLWPDPAGGIRRPRPRQSVDVRGLRGAFARLYRRRLARHALGNRGGTHPVRRHAGAEGAVAAEDRLGRGAADGRLHRAQHRLRPRLAAHPRRAGTATSTRSPATRRGSPTPSAPT